LTNINEISGFIWSIADSVLRGSYKRNEYQKVILPFTVLKRFDSVLEYSKKDVVDTYETNKGKTPVLEPILMAKAVDENGRELGFYNYSKFDFKTLLQDPDNLEQNITYYINSFSKNVTDILENFDIEKQIAKLSKANLLYLLIKKFNETDIDLSPKHISNHDMGTIFEELIRKFSETSNEEAGEHFTPRDVVKLMTELLFVGEDEASGSIKLIYDPACGTGGMLTSCKEFITKNNPDIDVVLYGQEINDEIYAICKADMLMKGENAENIKGPSSTLSDDQLPSNKFDYMISNPPYGRDWEQDKQKVDKEAEEFGFDGRFGAGLPRKGDGQLLFIQHMISKMKDNGKSRIAVITNGSPLFAGDAGSGESNIRKWIFENDYLEALIALPDQLFFNTGIGTYVWVLTNEKTSQREGKVQLIDARDEFEGMRKSLGNKRHLITDESITKIIKAYEDFNEGNNVKIFYNEDFGYTKITVERPMQLNYQVTPIRLENLYSYNQFKKLAESNSKDLETRLNEEDEGKKQQEAIKEALLTIGDDLYTDWDIFEVKVNKALKSFDLKPAFIKNIIEKLSEHDDTAKYVTDKRGNPKPDSNLRSTEKIPLVRNIDDYFEDEVLKYYPNAWYEPKKNKIGYEINFTKFFYSYNPPRSLESIGSDITKKTNDIKENAERINTILNKNKYASDLEIPETWISDKIKHQVEDKPYSIVDGPFGTQLHNDEYVDEGVPVVRIVNLNYDGNFDPEKLVFITEEKYQTLKRSSVTPGDLIVAKTGATIGKVGVFEGYEKGIIASSCLKISLNNKISPEFFKYYLISDYCQKQILLSSSGSTRDTINMEQIANLDILLPKTSDEQNKIANYLDDNINEINKNIDTCKEYLELLEEYKTSLIYHATTGKIKFEE